MANEVVEEEKANGNAEERTSVKRASTAELYADFQTAPHPVLPSNARVEYFDEGAANIVYKLSLEPSLGHQERYKNVFPNLGKRPAWSLWDGKAAIRSSFSCQFPVHPNL
jgi:hypothetical protein